MRIRNLLVVLIAVTLVASAFAGGAQGKPAAVKSLTWALNGQVEEMDPAMSNYFRANMFLKTNFAGLFEQTQDGQMINMYAKDHTVSADGTVWDVNIVPGAKWSDGAPLTAYDFEYGIKRMIDPKNASRAVANSFYLKNAQRASKGEVPMDQVGVKALSDTHLRLELTGPYPFFQYLLCGPNYFPARKDIIEKNGANWVKSPDTYIGNGPYKAVSIGELEYRMVKNPNFILASGVQIDELKIVVMESLESHYAAYKMGDIDVTDYLSGEAIREYRNSPEFGKSARTNLQYFNFNHYKGPTADVRVRKALSMAIDRNQIITKILERDHRPAFGVVPFGMPSLTNPAKQFRDIAGNRFKEDVAEAKRLLAEAGFPNGTGMPTLRFYTMNNQIDTDTAQAMQSMWKANLGVNCEITTFESRAYWAEQPKMDNYDIFRDGWTSGYPDPQGILIVWEPARQSYQSGWTSKIYDDNLAKSSATADPKIREDAFLAIEKVMMDEMVIIPYYFMVDNILIKPHVKGVYKTPGGHILFIKAAISR